MSTKLTELLKKVFYGSLAGISATSSANAMDEIKPISIPDGTSKIEALAKKKIDLTPKLLLKKSVNNELIAVAHRSHRSHSSHRSHYSSSLGGSSGTYTPPRSTYSPPSSSYSSPNSIYTPQSSSNLRLRTTTTTKALRLGARTLKRGMSGTDVTELINILIQKSYLINDGSGPVVGSSTFTSTVEEAVKQFQANNGLTSDGICGAMTIYYLKNK